MLFLLLACGPKTTPEPSAQAIGKASCERPEGLFGPVVRDDALHAEASRFSQLGTTTSTPVEACGIEGQLQALLRMTCDDGSSPFSSAAQAHDARSGNLGAGGRCGSIIDLYQVPCPEATYPVHIDMYVCPSR